MTESMLVSGTFVFMALAISFAAGVLSKEQAWFTVAALCVLSVVCLVFAYFLFMGWTVTVSVPF